MQIGMPALIEYRTLEDNAALCRELGLSFVELNMNYPEYQVECLEKSEHLEHVAEMNRIYYTIHLDEKLDIADFNSLVSGAYLETVRRVIFAAKKLIYLRDRYGDASQPITINMHIDHGIYITLPERRVYMYERNAERYIDSFSRFRELCEEWIGDDDLVITAENTDGFTRYEKKAVECLLQSPKFGLTWDVGHSKTSGEKDVPFIMEHRERIVHFHIHDACESPPRNHLPLGEGKIALEKRLELADVINSRCVIETKTDKALRSSVKWLHDHCFL